ncbi:MAG TPA: DoxX family protein [Rubrobacteraceae bacterium]|nr:DoxX family protein [Rubrobacteraceae bacterium]
MLDVGLLVLRVVLGVIFAAHGAQKLFGSFGGPGLKGTAGFHEQLGIKPPYLMAVLAGLAEFAGGILVAVGLLTPLAAVALIVTMAVAALTVHLKNGFFAMNGGYEFNLALAGMALTLLLTGAGAISLDAALGIVLW